jgi:type IV secretory pathway TraG/TraD family ATPase VirD4
MFVAAALPGIVLPPSLVITAVSATAIAVALGRNRSFARSPDRHRRGALVRSAHPIGARRREQWRHQKCLCFAGVPISLADETKHFKLLGTTGTGKSTAIRQLLSAALERGDRAVIADPEGAFLRCLSRRYRGDVVLNPFENYSVKWDITAELHSDYDAEQLASALISNSADPSAQEWRGYARTFVSCVLWRSKQDGITDLDELWRRLVIASQEELRRLLQDCPAQTFLDPENGRMFASIRSVATSAIAALAYIRNQRSTLFSVRDWVRCGRGVLFIPYRSVQIAALRSMISAWVRLSIFEAMNHGGDFDQRLWFVVDELDALGPIDGLKDALARLRKFGGRCVLGFQSVAQVSNTYGAGEAQTLVENCGNTLILRCAGSEHGGTSQFASRLIGEREIVRQHRSLGRDSNGFWKGSGGRRSTQLSEQRMIETAVLPAELEQLPDLTGFLKTASSKHWSKVRLGYHGQNIEN